ncbi:MAG: hypothetical protein MUC42_04085, partial [Bryobacter sp.]|nr:hypothetical protein [Bryobacter sp.]
MRINGVLASFLALIGVVEICAQECQITLLSPAQPPLKVQEGERATESETFLTALMTLSPANEVYIFDGASRIRRLSADGRLFTVAGNGLRGEQVTPGDARAASLPAITQMIFSRDGVLHFTHQSRVFRIVSGEIEVVVGSGRPGFNGEEGPAREVNLGNVVNMTFNFENEMLLLDGFNRLRKLGKDGILRTIAGSTRVAASTGLTGDNGPATQAALSSPRQVVSFSDGTIWIKDL